MISGHPGGLQLQVVPSNQFVGMYPTMQNAQMAAMYSQQMLGGQMPMQGGQMIGYGYGQYPEAQYNDPRRSMYPYGGQNDLSRRMHGLNMQESSTYMNKASYGASSTSLLQSNKPSKPEDKLFGDLVNIAKSKQNKSTASNAGGL